MIKNENDFLKILLENCNQNGDCNMYKILNENDISSFEAYRYISSLENKGYVKVTDLNTVHIFPEAKEFYNSPFKKIRRKLFSLISFGGNIFIQIFIGASGAIIAAYIVWKFGLQ